MEIRNFAIVAHIDHGKSTLADRLLEKTGTVKPGSGEQLLDTMELEKERGITIKLNPARMFYKPKGTGDSGLRAGNNSGESNQPLKIENSTIENSDSVFQLNLIDTPGHVDFSYEVSRSLASVEGVILLVDASQGIQAQTLTNFHLAEKHNLTVIPVVNKIDLPTAQVEDTAKELMDLLECEYEDICFVSGKTGEGVEDLLETIVKKVPSPKINKEAPLQALVFDSYFDQYLGVVAYVKVFGGEMKKNQKLRLAVTGINFEAIEIGFPQIKKVKTDFLDTGEIGYIATGLKTVQDCRVGDTIIGSPETPAWPGYKTPKPMIFASFFPDAGRERDLGVALDKLKLTDASLTYEPINSKALGLGYTVGFLGLLHLEIIKERIEREYDLTVLVTTPTVAYQDLNTPEAKEPWVDLEVVGPHKYYGAVSELVSQYRAEFISIDYLGDRAICRYQAPLSDIIADFYDRLKSVTSGYASMDYQLSGYRIADLVAVDLMIAGDKIDALTQYIVREKAERYGRQLVERLKNLIPRQNFEVAVQAAIGGKIIARADISAFRKDVIAKLYGGDVTRKNKLLDKQKKGKKRMRHLGRIEIPSEVFVELLKKD